jgi:4-amino-4-deoxy-L-arabinose transferase-like glycosyltransferase
VIASNIIFSPSIHCTMELPANFKNARHESMVSLRTLKVDWKKFKALLSTHYPLIGVLIATWIVLASMGTYTNWDAQTEFEAASSVVTRGFPYVTTGLMIDQPPFAFYMTAPVLQAFGLSYVNGVGFVTTLGLGCVALIYILGTILYGKKTGLVAAALFGLVPWQVFMARTYLIDVQYMFLGLLFLIFGVLAVKRNSEKLLAVSGVLFALAFLTKLFTVFLLIPLLLMILLKGKENGFKVTLRKTLIFLVPCFILQALWFGGFANQNFFGVYVASDLTHPILISDPSFLFLPRIFVESAGWFLPAAAVFGLIIAVSFRHLLSRTLWGDVVCAFTILAVVGVDLVLVLGRHLLVPYVSAFKYDYAALPFLCLLAGSLADKGRMLVGSVGKRKVKLILVGFGLSIVFASLLENIMFLNHSEPYPLIDFKVDYTGHYFPFNVFTSVSSYFQIWHYTAVALMILSIFSPFILSAFKKQFGQLSKILSS